MLLYNPQLSCNLLHKTARQSYPQHLGSSVVYVWATMCTPLSKVMSCTGARVSSKPWRETQGWYFWPFRGFVCVCCRFFLCRRLPYCISHRTFILIYLTMLKIRPRITYSNASPFILPVELAPLLVTRKSSIRLIIKIDAGSVSLLPTCSVANLHFILRGVHVYS